jgi:hypothetical protein
MCGAAAASDLSRVRRDKDGEGGDIEPSNVHSQTHSTLFQVPAKPANSFLETVGCTVFGHRTCSLFPVLWIFWHEKVEQASLRPRDFILNSPWPMIQIEKIVAKNLKRKELFTYVLL